MRRLISRLSPHCSALLVALLACLLVACGAPSGKTAGGAPKATATRLTQPTPTAVSTPGPTSFSATWTPAWNTTPSPLIVDGGEVTDTPSTLLSQQGPSGYAFAPSNPQIGYACGGGVGGSTVLYATQDGGASWQRLAGAHFTWCATVFVDQGNASDVFATQVSLQNNADNEVIWHSQNGGASWQKLNPLPITYSAIVRRLEVVGSRVIVNATPEGIGNPPDTLYYSDDGGASWRPLANALATANSPITYFTRMGNTLYVGNNSGQATGGPFWRSTDAGATWNRVTFPGTIPYFARAANGQSYYALSIANDETASYTSGATITTCWWSADGGATWRKLPALAGAEHGYVVGGGNVITLAPDGSVFVIAQHGPKGQVSAFGVYRIQPSDAAATWQPFVNPGFDPQYPVVYWSAVMT
ncbi:MAG: sialidase family protein, partial [Ktedonobacterales bacterium]